MFETDLQQVVYYDRYARWNEQLGRRETWEETVNRVMTFFMEAANKRGIDITSNSQIEWRLLNEAMYAGDVMPSMRVVQMAGPALERCNVGVYNCSYLPLQDWRAFGELLYILMQGTGVGFSVEQQYVEQLPLIKCQTGLSSRYVIADTTEAWADALVYGLRAWANGDDVEFDYSAIRPFGAPLKMKGGTASGPEPLKQLLDFARTMMLRHQGRRLSSLNLHDLACFCGSIVQVGGVRRAAEISLSDLADKAMRGAKQGQFWLTASERSMANNSAVYTTKPSMGEFFDEWRELMSSGTGERGIFNREGINAQMPARRSREAETKWGNKPIQFGVNPCGEIVLRPFQFCNLSIAVARPDDTQATLLRKVQLATQFGIIQSLLTDFNYLRPEWRANCEEERLLGVDITGQMDCPLLNGTWADDQAFVWDGNASTYQASLWLGLRDGAIEEARRLSRLININMPAAVTCVKPSGNSAQLLGTSSGLHPRYANYYIRRVRIGSQSPVAKLLIDTGIPHHPEVGQSPDNPSVWVFDFPVESPDGAITRHKMTALDQLWHWLGCKRNFTEHNPSITVYVKPDEWMEVGAWVYKHWQWVGGISFLPFDGGIYNLAPYEEITENDYNRLTANRPVIDWGRLQQYEHSDHTTVNTDYACVGGTCDL